MTNKTEIVSERRFHPVKKIAVITLSVIGVATALTYGKWEVLTLLHGQEFTNTITLDKIVRDDPMQLTPPKFIKVIEYSNNEADVLWVSEREGLTTEDLHMYITFKKQKTDSGQIVGWVSKSGGICTPANGSPTAYFPFYGGIPETPSLLEVLFHSII